MVTGVVDHKVGSADLGGEPEGDNESNEGFGGEHPSGGCDVLVERAGDLKGPRKSDNAAGTSSGPVPSI